MTKSYIEQLKDFKKLLSKSDVIRELSDIAHNIKGIKKISLSTDDLCDLQEFEYQMDAAIDIILDLGDLLERLHNDYVGEK